MINFPTVKVSGISVDFCKKLSNIFGTSGRTKLRRQLTPDEIIDAIPKHRIYQRDTVKGPESFCRLCFRQFCEGEYIKRFPGCKHKYHEFCIDNWLKWVGPYCPEDKMKLIPVEDEADVDEEIRVSCNHALQRKAGSTSDSPDGFYKEKVDSQEMGALISESKKVCKKKEKKTHTERKQDHNFSHMQNVINSLNLETTVDFKPQQITQAENRQRVNDDSKAGERSLDLAMQRLFKSRLHPRSNSHSRNNEQALIFEDKQESKFTDRFNDMNESNRLFYRTMFSRFANTNSSDSEQRPTTFHGSSVRDDFELMKKRQKIETVLHDSSKYGLMSLESRVEFQKAIDDKKAKIHNLLEALSEAPSNPVLMLRSQFPDSSRKNRGGSSLYTKPRKLEYE